VTDQNRILVAIIGAPHGVRGEVRLKSLTGDPAAIGSYGLLHDDSGRSFEIAKLRPLKEDMVVAQFKGLDNRDSVAALTHHKLYLDRALLPEPDEDEFYHADLIGLRAETETGDMLGTVRAVENYGAGDILEIKPQNGGETLLFSFTRAVVPLVDVKGGRVVIVPPIETEGEDRPVESD
jgi:16S rRNA processing protein RimM